MKQITVNTIVYRIGRNAKDNTQLIKDSDPNWVWFHLAKFPSCHVVACVVDPDKTVVDEAAALVKSHSKYKFTVSVNYCKISNLKHADKDGAVMFISNKQVSTVTL
jgi:predicted ribosome quality control (RQC) complex YloA/Tae2 family protein